MEEYHNNFKSRLNRLGLFMTGVASSAVMILGIEAIMNDAETEVAEYSSAFDVLEFDPDHDNEESLFALFGGFLMISTALASLELHRHHPESD